MSSAVPRRPSVAEILAWALAVMLLGMAPATWAGVTVQLTDPDNGTVYAQAPTNIVLWASASSSQGYTVSKVEFFHGSTLIGTGISGSPYRFVWNDVQPGSYSLTAKATAVKKKKPNQTATSSPVNITVNARPVVTLTSPADRTEYPIPPPPISLNATAGDADGTIVKVEFYDCANNGGLITTITTAPYTFNWNPPTPYWQVDTFSVYGIRADATDNLGAIGSSGCKILSLAPTITLTSPANDGSYAAPATIALNAAVSPADGPIGKVKFYNGSTLLFEDLTAPYSFTWDNVGVGTYALIAVVVESAGREWPSAPVNVTVTAASAQPKLHFIHVDQLNTPRLITNQAQQAVWRYDQAEPFGNSPPYENPSGLGAFEFPLRFSGQYADKETNLAYNYFRDYDGGLGRYVQSDLIGINGGLNTYLYANANPLRYVDRFGLDTAGCDGVPSIIEGPCTLRCCARHDECFDKWKCTGASWRKKDGCFPRECDKCNKGVRDCLTTCTYKRKHNADWPMYYCARQHRYVSIPGDFSSQSAAEAACEHDHSNDRQCCTP